MVEERTSSSAVDTRNSCLLLCHSEPALTTYTPWVPSPCPALTALGHAITLPVSLSFPLSKNKTNAIPVGCCASHRERVQVRRAPSTQRCRQPTDSSSDSVSADVRVICNTLHPHLGGWNSTDPVRGEFYMGLDGTACAFECPLSGHLLGAPMALEPLPSQYENPH